MSHDEIDGDLGVSRRQLIKRGAVVGGTVLWAAPVVQSLTTPALGQTALYPPPCTNCATAAAFGLRALGLTFGQANGTGCQCLANVNATVGTIGGASAQLACGKADAAACTASSYLAGLVVNLGPTSNGTTAFLEVSALSSCVANGTGASRIVGAGAKLVIKSLLGVVGQAALTGFAGCNSGINIGAALGQLGVTLLNPVEIRFNEQECSGGVLTVNALRVTVAALSVVVAQAQAGGPNCTCTPCATNAACTPPESRLC